MQQTLEVIATSLSEAIEAHAGGADRLELVRALDQDGLSPDLDLVRQILAAVPLPVRVMLRENASMSVSGNRELALLQAQAAAFAELPIDGLVLGWVTSDREVDITSIHTVLDGLTCRVTFHRAIEHVADPLQAIRILKQFPQIDRILTSGGPGIWPERKARLLDLQTAAAPEIQILLAVGIASDALTGVFEDASFNEVHVGRAVRHSQEVSGAVERQRVAALKNMQRP
ncbi:MAG TPA: copper homeostasis protein CutC [Bryobacteraceae bacterium]|jgi:copper homeostasis protein